jgi:hypothetical protein
MPRQRFDMGSKWLPHYQGKGHCDESGGRGPGVR